MLILLFFKIKNGERFLVSPKKRLMRGYVISRFFGRILRGQIKLLAARAVLGFRLDKDSSCQNWSSRNIDDALQNAEQLRQTHEIINVGIQ